MTKGSAPKKGTAVQMPTVSRKPSRIEKLRLLWFWQAMAVRPPQRQAMSIASRNARALPVS